MSLAGQWDTVNGEVLKCQAVQPSMDHDDQLEHFACNYCLGT